MKANRALSPMDRVVGRWIVTGSHPMLPGRTLRGEALFERIEDGAFVRLHTKMVDPEIPEGVAIFGTDGDDDACTMLYFDVRGVARRYDVVFHEDGLEWKRDSAEFAQTYRLKITADGKSMEGQGTMKRAGA
ncbi:MAG TPA: hypothetical protein VF407_04210, partial [Polyangiaceae bacterium]